MRPRTVGFWAPPLLLLTATLAAAAEVPPTAHLQDEAGLFSEDALAEARHRLREFRREHERDLAIETIPSVPGSTWRWMLRMKPRRLTSYAGDQVKKRQQASGLPAGIYVLFCQDPPSAVVATWPDRNPTWFPERDQAHISERLTRSLNDESPDRVLQQALGEVRQQLQPPPAPPVNPLTLVGLFAGLLAAWVVLALLAARASRADPETAGLPPPPADLRAAWLGTLFGLPATGWIHDRLFQASAPPDAPPDEGDLFANGPAGGVSPRQSAPSPATDAPHSPFGYDPESTWKG